MANNLDSTNLFNPVMLWTDVGMRALEMTLSSSQNIGEGLDRLARAGADASVETIEAAELPRALRSDKLEASSPLALVAQMQQATFELMTNAWQQWMNTFAALASMGAGRTFAETIGRQNPLVNAMREGIQWRGGDASAATRSGSSSRQQGGRERESHTGAREHAVARAEPKRRSRATAVKSKSRSRNSS